MTFKQTNDIKLFYMYTVSLKSPKKTTLNIKNNQHFTSKELEHYYINVFLNIVNIQKVFKLEHVHLIGRQRLHS